MQFAGQKSCILWKETLKVGNRFAKGLSSDDGVITWIGSPNKAAHIAGDHFIESPCIEGLVLH